MSFYKEMSSVYDIIFPEDEETTNFLCDKLKDHGNIIDLACGTGNYTIALARRGFNTYGVDLDEAMIKIAEKKIKDEKVVFYVGDMISFSNLFIDKKFDLAYCIGNSLVHLENKKLVGKFLKEIYETLDNGGTFITQIINYDRIMSRSINSLPTIDRKEEGVKFIRNYRRDPNKDTIFFETKLSIKKDNSEKVYENSVPLIPLKSSELTEMIKEAGFSKIEVYGGFNYEEFNEESYILVVRAMKL